MRDDAEMRGERTRVERRRPNRDYSDCRRVERRGHAGRRGLFVVMAAAMDAVDRESGARLVGVAGVRRRAVALCRTRHFTCGTRDRRRGDHRH